MEYGIYLYINVMKLETEINGKIHKFRGIKFFPSFYCLCSFDRSQLTVFTRDYLWALCSTDLLIYTTVNNISAWLL